MCPPRRSTDRSGRYTCSMARTTPPFDRVMRQTEWQGECLVFTGIRNGKGYGYIQQGAESKKTLSHRVVWERHYGAIVPGLIICHTCDNPPCVNIDHLWLGDYKSNAAHMVEKGRHFNPQSLKTHCNAGHPFDEKNTRVLVRSDGRASRMCRECQRLASARWRSRQV